MSLSQKLLDGVCSFDYVALSMMTTAFEWLGKSKVLTDYLNARVRRPESPDSEREILARLKDQNELRVFVHDLQDRTAKHYARIFGGLPRSFPENLRRHSRSHLGGAWALALQAQHLAA